MKLKKLQIKTEENNDKSITVITCYYKVKSKHSFKQYALWIHNLLTNINANLVIFTSENQAKWLAEYFNNDMNPEWLKKNPYTIKPLYHHQMLNSVYERTNMLMGQMPNFAGYVAGPINSVKQSLEI